MNKVKDVFYYGEYVIFSILFSRVISDEDGHLSVQKIIRDSKGGGPLKVVSK